MEGVKLAGFNGDIEMRATDHQLLQPLWIVSWTKVGGAEQATTSRRPATRGRRRVRPDLRCVAADQLRHEAASVSRKQATRRPNDRARRNPRAGFIEADLMEDPTSARCCTASATGCCCSCSAGPDPDLLDDGRAEFRARELLHAGRLFRLPDQRVDRLLAGAVLAPVVLFRDRRAGRALGTARACTSGAMCPSCCSPSGCRTSSSSWCR